MVKLYDSTVVLVILVFNYIYHQRKFLNVDDFVLLTITWQASLLSKEKKDGAEMTIYSTCSMILLVIITG